MSNTTNLATQIEDLVREHLARTQREVAVMLDRLFTPTASTSPKRAGPAAGRKRRASSTRRDAEVVSELAERLYKAVCSRPGERMSVFAEQLDVSVRDLHRPMTNLKRTGRLRSVGQRSQTRYYPGLTAHSGTK